MYVLASMHEVEGINGYCFAESRSSLILPIVIPVLLVVLIVVILIIGKTCSQIRMRVVF